MVNRMMQALSLARPDLFSSGGAYRLEIISAPSKRVWSNSNSRTDSVTPDHKRGVNEAFIIERSLLSEIQGTLVKMDGGRPSGNDSPQSTFNKAAIESAIATGGTTGAILEATGRKAGMAFSLK